jgi:lipoprotein-releasing system permease protein
MSVPLPVLLLCAAVLVATAVLLLAYPFERRVGLRYLGRTAPASWGRLRRRLFAAAGLGAAGGLLLLAGRGAWQAEIGGAGVILLAVFGALAALVFHRLALFTAIAMLGLSLGVAALLVVLAVTSGFQRDFLRRVSAFHAHLVVGLYNDPPLPALRTELGGLARKLADLPGLVQGGPFAVTAAEVLIGNVGAQLKAIDLGWGAPAVARWMIDGRLEDLARPAACPDPDAAGGTGRMLLGAELARALHARTGDCLSVVVPYQERGELKLPVIPFKVVGVYRMGFHQHDARLAFIALDDVALFDQAKRFIYGLELELADPFAALALEPEVVARVGDDYRVLDWRLLGSGFFSMLATQRVVVGLFLLLIVVVAAFNLLAALYIVVISKTRELAVLGALGARRRALQRIFITTGAAAGLVGVGVGVALGLAVCALLGAYHYPLDPAIYMVSQLPVALEPGDVLLVAGVAQLVCLAATIPPVRRASRLQIVEGLRHT